VKLRLQAPPGTTLSSGDGWTCQSSADGASCERTRLDPAAATALAFAVVPPKTAPTFAITASVTASEFDPSPSNNSATLQLENDAPTPDGGCTMGRGRAPTAAGPPAVALGLLLAALARRRRRVR
jgi:hypothetical protein